MINYLNTGNLEITLRNLLQSYKMLMFYDKIYLRYLTCSDIECLQQDGFGNKGERKILLETETI